MRRLVGELKSRSWKAHKVFGVGRGKTGTTSLAAALNEMGYRVAPQEPAEMLLEEWSRRDFERLKHFCKDYDAFQDVPFCYPFTYQAMDQAFPNAKFVLTVRESADEWYRSLTRFHALPVGATGVPTAEDIKKHTYRYPGYVWDCQRLLYGISESQAYDPTIYKAHYEAHNAAVIDYFRWRPEKLLVLNVKDSDALQKLGRFLSLDVDQNAPFPWENPTG